MEEKLENIEFGNACVEVLSILEYIKTEDLDKIPQFEIDNLKYHMNVDYKFKYDIKKNINEQYVSKMAKAIIAIFFEDYIANDRQKGIIENKRLYDEEKNEEEKRMIYNSDDIFKNRNNISNSRSLNNKNISSNKSLIEVQNIKWYKKIWNIIKNIFR